MMIKYQTKKILIKDWRTRQDSNLRPLPSEGKLTTIAMDKALQSLITFTLSSVAYDAQ